MEEMEKSPSLYEIYKYLIIENEWYLLSKEEIIKKLSGWIGIKDNSIEDIVIDIMVKKMMRENKELFIVAGNEDEEL